MPRETSKSIPFMERMGHFTKYLHGDGIDVGAGFDPLAIPDGTVRIWDTCDGDATLLATISDDDASRSSRA